MTDKYQMSPQAAQIERAFWTGRGTPKGEALLTFATDMQHMQIALIRVHFPHMGQADAERARRTLTYLEAELVAPGSAGAYASGGRHV